MQGPQGPLTARAGGAGGSFPTLYLCIISYCIRTAHLTASVRYAVPLNEGSQRGYEMILNAKDLAAQKREREEPAAALSSGQESPAVEMLCLRNCYLLVWSRLYSSTR